MKNANPILRILQKWLNSLWLFLLTFIVSRTGACSGITPNENERARFLVSYNDFSETLLRVAFYRVCAFLSIRYLPSAGVYSPILLDSLQAVFPSSTSILILAFLQKIYLCTVLQPFRRNSFSSIYNEVNQSQISYAQIFSFKLKIFSQKYLGGNSIIVCEQEDRALSLKVSGKARLTHA